MKIQTFSSILVAMLALQHTAYAQLPKLEQKTAFCATSVELPGKRDSSDLYLCETKEYTCGAYLKSSCLDDAKQGNWQVVSGTQKTVLKDFANTPCKCVGTEYVLTRKVEAAAGVGVVNTPAAPVAAPVVLPVAASVASAAAVPVVTTPARSLESEVEGLKQDNMQIRHLLEQLQRQIEELRRNLPATK